MGECIISSVQTLHNKDLNGGPVLYLSNSSVLFGKQRIVYPHGMRVGWPKRGGLNPSWFPLSICFVSSSLSLPYANWASREAGTFVSPEVLTPVCGISFVPFLPTFPFVFYRLPFWTHFSYSY